jgi:branched-subunit amino acid aminotransferase/4-amino-4-deoxychorismate lyase
MYGQFHSPATLTGVMELDGVAVDADQISALALTNYGHFTSMRVEGARVRGLSLHLDRLRADCRAVFDTELDTDHVRRLVREAVRHTAESVVVRVTVFDPDLDFGHPGAAARPQILVTTRSATAGADSPLTLRSVDYRRELPTVKHVGLFPALYHRRLAQLDAFDDVLFADPDNGVSEIATSNIGVIRGDRVIWPSAPCLPGVTMRLIDLARGERHTARIDLADLADAEAVFATNAAVGIRPIGRIDDMRWSPGIHSTLRAIREQYAAITPEPL